MNALDYTLSFLKLVFDFLVGIAWPVALLIILWIFREHVSFLWERVTSVDVAGFKATFDRGLDRAEKSASAAAIQAPSGELENNFVREQRKSFPPPDLTYSEQIRALAEVSPQSAIIAKWVEVETQLRRMAASKSILDTESAAPIFLLRELVKSGAISNPTLQAVNELRQMRNFAAHGGGKTLTADDSLRFVGIANVVLKLLRNEADQK
jgi:hypothetical protein